MKVSELSHERVACALCGVDDTRVVARRGRDGVPLTTEICRGCGLVYLNPRPTREGYREFYLGGVHEQEYRGDRVSESYVRNQFRKGARIRRFLEGLVDPRGKEVLEIGSTSGGILADLRDHGAASVKGVDADPSYVAHARDELGVDTELGFFEEMELRGRYDLVVMRHVLEHVLDPVAALVRVRGLLREGGVVYLEVPNLLSLDRTRGMHHNFHLAHPYVFSPRTLRAVVSRAGFAVARAGETDGYARHIRMALTVADDAGDWGRWREDWRRVRLSLLTYHLVTPLRRLYLAVRGAVGRALRKVRG